MGFFVRNCRIFGILLLLHVLAVYPATASPLAASGDSPDCTGDTIRFFVVGHIYGQPEISPNPPVAKTLLSNLMRIKKEKPTFIVLLGDVVERPTSEAFEILSVEHLTPLAVPIFNAPGNHDLLNPKNYEAAWGETHLSFICGASGFLVLNTEAEGRPLARQLNHAKAFIERVAAATTVKNLFVFSHKLVWAAADGKYDLVGRRSHWQGQSPLFQSMLPILRALNGRKRIFWGSGDLGLQEGFSTFLDYDRATGITWYAAGLGDHPSDAIAEVVVERGKSPKLYKRSLVPTLSGRQELDSMTKYYFRSAIRKLKSFF